MSPIENTLILTILKSKLKSHRVSLIDDVVKEITKDLKPDELLYFAFKLNTIVERKCAI